MSYTAAEIATRALREPGLIAAEETPSAEDMAWALETLSSEAASMRVRGIRFWGGSATVLPEEYLVPLARRIALPMSASFGLVSIPDGVAAQTALERELRALGSTGNDMPSTVAQADYF